jgi:hypothetical protein
MTPEPETAAWPRQLARAVVRWGIDGAPLPGAWVGGPGLRLRSALELAHGVRFRAERIGLDAAIIELIDEQARWNAGSGFLSGVGGFAFLPVQLPLALTATWVIQTRLVHEAVRSRILLTLLGEEAGLALKQLGVKAGQRFAEEQLRRLVLRRAGGQGLSQLNRAIPLVGGLVGGGIDYLLTRQLGRYAASSLRQRQPAQGAEGVIDVEILG